jgi:hypothetical protein
MQNLVTVKPTPNYILFSKNTLSGIQNHSTTIWRDQPMWPTKRITFYYKDNRRRRHAIRALTSPVASPDMFYLGTRIFNCDEYNPCKSPLCNYCRQNYQDHYQQIVLDTFKDYGFNDLYFLTVLDDLTYDPINHIKTWKRRFKDRIKDNLENIFGNDVQMFGALEVDVKDTSQLVPADKAYQLLMKYGLNTNYPIAYMPHFHGIVAAKGTSAKRLGDKLRTNFNKSHQISVSRLRYSIGGKPMTKKKNLKRMARYMFKFRYQFADNIMRAKPSYGTRFDDDTMRTYAQVCHDIKGHRGLNGFTVRHNLSTKY